MGAAASQSKKSRKVIKTTAVAPSIGVLSETERMLQIKKSESQRKERQEKWKDLPTNSIWDQIPRDIYNEIFSFLSLDEISNCYFVCRFRFISINKKKWTTISFAKPVLNLEKSCLVPSGSNFEWRHLKPFLILGNSALQEIYGLEMINIGDKGLQELSLRCPRLRVLELKGCENINSGNFKYLAFPQLTILSLHSADHLSDEDLASLLSSLPLLEHFHLWSDSPRESNRFGAALSNLPNLLTMSFQGSRYLPSDFFKRLGGKYQKDTKFPKLQIAFIPLDSLSFPVKTREMKIPAHFRRDRLWELTTFYDNKLTARTPFGTYVIYGGYHTKMVEYI